MNGRMRYQKRMDRPLSITLVTGFLGSGKTTLIRRLLPDPLMRGSLVIVNDLAPIGLDHLLLQDGDNSPILLANGCICCTVNEDLGVTLLDLLRRNRAGELPPILQVIVETTGMADPIPVMQLLADNPTLAQTCVLDRVVTLIDARHGAAQLERHLEAQLQVAVADFVLLGHIDETDEAERQRLAAILVDLNPVADLVDDAAGFTAMQLLVRTRMSRISARDVIRQRMPASNGHEVVVACLTANHPIVWERLVDWVEQVGDTYRDDLLRIKGTVSIAGLQASLFINVVQQSFYPPIVLPNRFDPFGFSQLVVIGRNLDPVTLQATFGH